MPELLDVGNHFRGTNGELLPFIDKHGRLGECLLNGAGRPLPPASEEVYVNVLQAEFDAGLARNSAGELFASVRFGVSYLDPLGLMPEERQRLHRAWEALYPGVYDYLVDEALLERLHRIHAKADTPAGAEAPR